MNRMLGKATLIAGIVLATLGLASYVLLKGGAFKPRVSVAPERGRVAPDSSAVGNVALSEAESRALGRVSARGFTQPFTAADIDSLNAVWATIEQRTGRNVSQKGAQAYAGGLRVAHDYLHEFQKCLLTSFDMRKPVTTPRLLALRKRVVEGNVMSPEKVSADSSLIDEAATGITRDPETGMRTHIAREGMVVMLHRIEQLWRNVDFLDSALAITPAK